MLLVKYDSFDVVTKDSFIEELLYKYEKNVGHLQAFEKKGRGMIHDLAQVVVDASDMQEVVDQVLEMYVPIEELAQKVTQLGLNQEYVHKTLTDALNTKLRNMQNHKTSLSQVYILHSQLNKLHKELTEDCINKAKVIQVIVPQIIFGEDGTSDLEEEFNLALDLWSYYSRVELSIK